VLFFDYTGYEFETAACQALTHLPEVNLTRASDGPMSIAGHARCRNTDLNCHTGRKGRMMRPNSVVLGFVSTLLMSTNSEAQTTNSDSDDVRYSYNRVDNGFLRLDMRSGEVSLCSAGAGRWSCAPVPDDRRTLGDDIARLQRENAALKKMLLDHGLPLPNGTNTETNGSSDGSRKTDSGKVDNGKIEEQPDKALNDAVVAIQVVVGKLWRELVVMIMNLENGVLKKKT
jgi:hypothetical protein